MKHIDRFPLCQFMRFVHINSSMKICVHKEHIRTGTCQLNSLVPETKIAEVANSIDLDEVAYHHKPPHLDLHYLPSSL